MSLLDTISSAFKGGGPNRVPLKPAFTSPWAHAFGGGASSGSLDYSEAIRRGFVSNPITQRAVRIVAEGVGQAPLLATDAALIRLVTATSAGQSLIETLAAQRDKQGARAQGAGVGTDSRDLAVVTDQTGIEHLRQVGKPEGHHLNDSINVCKAAATVSRSL